MTGTDLRDSKAATAVGVSIVIARFGNCASDLYVGVVTIAVICQGLSLSVISGSGPKGLLSCWVSRLAMSVNRSSVLIKLSHN